MTATLYVLTAMSLLLALATVVAYERVLTRMRHQLEEALADADLATDLLVEHSRRRHPASYGGGNLRVINGGAE